MDEVIEAPTKWKRAWCSGKARRIVEMFFIATRFGIPIQSSRLEWRNKESPFVAPSHTNDTFISGIMY